MMLFYFLLPALAYGKISIYLDVTLDRPLADVGGHIKNDITAEDRKTFQIEDKQLIKYLQDYTEKPRSAVPAPVKVYVGHEPNALHKEYTKWKKVQKTVRPSWKVTTDEPTCGTVAEPYNNQNLSVKITWSQEHNISVAEELKYRIEIPQNPLSFDAAWQKTYDVTKVQEFAMPQPVHVKLCTVTANLEYKVSVLGDVAADFGKKWEGHYFWAFDIANVLEFADVKTYKVLNENITVEYYKSA